MCPAFPIMIHVIWIIDTGFFLYGVHAFYFLHVPDYISWRFQDYWVTMVREDLPSPQSKGEAFTPLSLNVLLTGGVLYIFFIMLRTFLLSLDCWEFYHRVLNFFTCFFLHDLIWSCNSFYFLARENGINWFFLVLIDFDYGTSLATLI